MFPLQSQESQNWPISIDFNFVDESGSPLPGGVLPGSPNTDLNVSGLSDVTNSSGFQWSVDNVNVHRGDAYVANQSENKAQCGSDPDQDDAPGDGDKEDDGGAPDGGSGTSAVSATGVSLRMAREMFQHVCSTTYWAPSFIFGAPHNPVISLQV